MIPLHSRVALAEGVDDVYQLALPGTQGWVRDHKKDPDGFDMVAVEWDKDHWRYNGQPDGWTFAEHFKVIGPPSASDGDKPIPLSLETELPQPALTDDQIEEFIEVISEAMEAASESDGFFILTVQKIPNPENPSEIVFVPKIFTQSISPEAEIILDVQLMECANANYQALTLSLLNKLKNESERPQ